MNLLQKTKEYVAENISASFHDKRIQSISRLRLPAILKRKNPYLFRAKAITSAPELVQQLLEAHLSSNEETLFGEFLETLAIFVCQASYGGVKSTSEGIDLEFQRDGQRYAVSIKSGPNWGNSRQISKMIADFNKIKRIAGHRANIICVNGCCYGQEGTPNKEQGYLKLCGQDFWHLISGQPEMYKTIVEPLGHQARVKCDEFSELYGKVLTNFTQEFTRDFCRDDGGINWEEILELNSKSKNAWRP